MRLVPAIVGSAVLVHSLNANIIANALPAIAHGMNQSVVAMNSTITAYLLASAMFLPISGWMADRYGARHVFRWAIIMYMICSVFCAISQTFAQLLIARALQGAAGSMMLPVARLVLLRTVPKRDMVTAWSYLTVPVLLGPAIGPPLGALVITFLSWRWIFLFTVPLGLAATVLVTIFVPNVRETSSPRLDVTGFILTGLGLGAVILAVQGIGRDDLPLPLIVAALGVATTCFVFYGWHARRTPYAIIDFSVLTTDTFRLSIIGGHFLRMMTGATPFLITVLLQVGFGFSALTAGLMTFSSAAAAIMMKATALPILRRFGFRQVLIVNGLITSGAFMACGLLRPSTPFPVIVALLFIGGFFRSLQFTALNALGYADISQEKMSQAATMQGVAQPIAQGMGIAVAAGMLHGLAVMSGANTLNPTVIGWTFLLLGGSSLLGLLFLLRLPTDAGSEVSGHNRANKSPGLLE